MKNIVCFGDSNTWGYNPESGERYPHEIRWTSVLQKELGSGYIVIPEGLNGRTTVWEDPFSAYRKGIEHLIPVLLTHKPIDLLVLMLGTNDSKNFLGNTPMAIGWGLRFLVETIQSSGCGRNDEAPAVLIVSPAPVKEVESDNPPFDIRSFASILGHNPTEVSKGLSVEYRMIADDLSCGFFDASVCAEVSGLDGVHLTEGSHAALGAALAGVIGQIKL